MRALVCMITLALLAPFSLGALTALTANTVRLSCQMESCKRSNRCCCKKAQSRGSKPVSVELRAAPMCPTGCTVLPASAAAYAEAARPAAHLIEPALVYRALLLAGSADSHTSGIDFVLFERPPPPPAA